MERKAASGIMLTLLLISMLTLVFNIQPIKAEPTTIIVPDDYPTIQEAINNANEGDTIYVKNGTYYENVVVNKTLSLVGENRSTTIIDGKGSGNVIYLTANNVNIIGFTIQNGGTSYLDSGVHVSSGSNNISYNVITSNSFGIVLHYSSNNTFSGNNIANNINGVYIYKSSLTTFLETT